jgi:hypothetical protein
MKDRLSRIGHLFLQLIGFGMVYAILRAILSHISNSEIITGFTVVGSVWVISYLISRYSKKHRDYALLNFVIFSVATSITIYLVAALEVYLLENTALISFSETMMAIIVMLSLIPYMIFIRIMHRLIIAR